MFNTLGRATSQTGKESGSAGCEQVSAARQTRSPIQAVTAQGIEMFRLPLRHESDIGSERLVLNYLSDRTTAAVVSFFVLIRALLPSAK